MNKRIRKKQNRVKKVSLNKLSNMEERDRIKYFLSRQVKKLPLLFEDESSTYRFEKMRYWYEPLEEEWEEDRVELEARYGQKILTKEEYYAKFNNS